MRPVIVKGPEDLKAVEEEFRRAGSTVVHNDDGRLSIYKGGKLVKVFKMKEDQS